MMNFTDKAARERAIADAFFPVELFFLLVARLDSCRLDHTALDI